MNKRSGNKIKAMAAAGLRVCFLWLWAFFLPGKTDAQIASCSYQAVNDSAFRIRTPADIIKIRKEIIRAIWNSDHIPDRSNVTVTSDIASPLHSHPVVARVDKIEIPTGIPEKRGSAPVNNLAYLFVPVKRNGRLMILHQGHSCTFKDTQDGNKGYRMELTIIGLLSAGYDVLAVYMPLVSDKGCVMEHCSLMNTDLGIRNPRSTFGLRLFLEPAIVSLNYLLKKNRYRNVNMMGLSGGGWSTTLIAAIDERIQFSFPVAGTMPMYERWGKSEGDVEQFLPQLYRDVAGYPDLYVLGSYGQGRKQVQILNLQDDCCFGQQEHNPRRNYKNDLRAYEQRVKDRLRLLGAPNHYYLVIDTTALAHQISGYALSKVILPELSSQPAKHGESVSKQKQGRP
jgi:hypothetical protein